MDDSAAQNKSKCGTSSSTPDTVKRASHSGRKSQNSFLPEYNWSIVGEGKLMCSVLLLSCFVLSNAGDIAPDHLPFRENPGCTVGTSCSAPIDCFSLLFQDTVWQYLVDNTNQYAAVKISKMKVNYNFIVFLSIHNL